MCVSRCTVSELCQPTSPHTNCTAPHPLHVCMCCMFVLHASCVISRLYVCVCACVCVVCVVCVCGLQAAAICPIEMNSHVQ